jgi:hypothetical protein
MGVVGRKDGDAVVAEGGDRAAVLARDRVDGRHELEVLALRVVDERDRRRGDLRKAGDLARVVHAQLDDRRPAAFAQAQQRQRQADVVVEVAFGGERRIADPRAEDRRDHLRHRRLAVAARDRDERHREAAPPRGRELAQRAPAVGDDEPGQRRLFQATLGERGDGAGGFGIGQIGVRVEALAAQGDEEVPRRDAAGVAVNARDRRRHAADDARVGQHSRRVVERHHRRAGRRSRCARCARRGLRCGGRARGERLGGMRRIRERELGAADVLVVLVALAGDEDDVFGGGAADAWAIASARFSITSTSSWPIAPARIWARIRSGDSRRGLSLVTTTRPASRHGDRSHQRPLGGVAVAAAAEHAPEPAAARLGERRQRGERLLERIGRVGVVDHDLGHGLAFAPGTLQSTPRRRPQRWPRRRAACGPAPASAPRTRSPRRRAGRRARAARR